MNATLRKRLFQAGSFVLAGALLYLALRGVEFAAVAADLRGADYRWIPPLIIVTLAGHWLRGWRWVQFLDALPPGEKATRPVTVMEAFAAVMIGYLANYAAPRVGEFVRTGNIAARSGLRFSAVLGTVAVERVLDVITMFLALFTLPLILSGRLSILREMILDPIEAALGPLPLVPILLGIVLLGAGALWLVVRLVRSPPGGKTGGVAVAIAAFSDGLLALLRTRKRGVVLFTTLGIWGCYALMAYIPFRIFGMDQAFGLGLGDAWALMLIGAIGVIIPSPGGIGTYHYFTIQSLMLFWAVPQSTAASYALLSHTGQLLLYVLVGVVAVLVQGIRIRVGEDRANEP